MEERETCPYCGKPMVWGRICSREGTTLEYLCQGLDPVFSSREEVEGYGGVTLAPRRSLRAGAVSCGAWHCPDCRKIVVAY